MAKNKFVANIPNLITGLRIITAIVLMFLLPDFSEPSNWRTFLFLILYGVCGLTDILDGFVARKFNLTSKLGSILDSIADWMFYSAMAVAILPVMIKLLLFYHWLIIITVFTIHMINYAVCAIKFKRFSAVHTYANKAQAICIFLFPFTFIGHVYWVYTLYIFICGAIALYSAVELFLIHIKARRYDVRNKTIFMVKRNEKDLDKIENN